MNIVGYIAVIYFVPAIIIMVYYGFKKDPDAVEKGLSWPMTVYKSSRKK